MGVHLVGCVEYFLSLVPQDFLGGCLHFMDVISFSCKLLQMMHAPPRVYFMQEQPIEIWAPSPLMTLDQTKDTIFPSPVMLQRI